MREYFINDEKLISIYDVKNDISDREYLSRLFQHLFDISEGVVVWLWTPFVDSELVMENLNLLKGVLNRVEQTGIDKYYKTPTILSYSFWKSSSTSLDKYHLLIRLLVDSWMSYDHPELFFIENSSNVSIIESTVMERKSRLLNGLELSRLYPYICCHKDPDVDVLHLENYTNLPTKNLLCNLRINE